MKKIYSLTIGTAVLAVGILSTTTRARAAAFTAGDLVVDQVGNGSAALTSAGTVVVLDEFNISGTAVQSIALGTTGNSVVQSGSASSEGFLHFTADGTALVVPGYNVAAGTSGVASATATAVPRAIAEFSLAGTQTNVTQLGTAFSGNNIRGAVGSTAANLFAVGGNTGVVTATAGVNGSTVISTTSTNNRDINIFGGNIYFTSGAGTNAHGLYEITGTAGTASQTATLVTPASNTSSPYGFSVSPDGTTAYVADSSSLLSKYTRTGSTGAFTLAYTTAIASGVTGLTVSYGATNTIYYDNPTTIYSAADTGAAFGAINTLATAATNTAFRGLDIVPTAVPEPATWVVGALSVLTLAWAAARRGLAILGMRGA